MTGELGVRIVTEVAAREGVDPAELTPPLHAVVDPEALDALFEPTSAGNRPSDGWVRFTYNGYEVTVAADGAVDVRETSAVRDGPDGRRGTAID
ncbi:HalOD1 output domain-containing protein [Halovivax sp.]|uniref:HalOD1 output domain-containing protein n=1 Tax=Halovivax sp. TaxID=1935978 RepID=UPI0025C335F8|nr:HalOD1 output domain-containing protein [Halovivax sp.]